MMTTPGELVVIRRRARAMDQEGVRRRWGGRDCAAADAVACGGLPSPSPAGILPGGGNGDADRRNLAGARLQPGAVPRLSRHRDLRPRAAAHLPRPNLELS